MECALLGPGSHGVLGSMGPASSRGHHLAEGVFTLVTQSSIFDAHVNFFDGVKEWSGLAFFMPTNLVLTAEF